MGCSSNAEPFGHHAPKRGARFLLALVRMGLSRGVLRRLIRNLWLRTQNPVVDATVHGVRYRLNLRNNNTDRKLLLSSKEYDARELTALAETAVGGVFVDIGANTGYYTLGLLRRGATRVIAIEPNPPTQERLRFNLEINQASEKVCVFAEGVGPEGELDFYQTGALGSASFLKPGDSTPVIKVRTRPLLALLTEAGVERVGSMKIDVEGFEDQALAPFLEGAPSSLLPQTLVMEDTNTARWAVDLASLLARRGYRPLRKTRGNMIYRRIDA